MNCFYFQEECFLLFSVTFLTCGGAYIAFCVRWCEYVWGGVLRRSSSKISLGFFRPDCFI
jgi:hypothetical protein